MSMTGVGGYDILLSFSGLNGTQSLNSLGSTQQNTATVTGSTSTGNTDSARISRRSALFNKLKQLQEADPQKFKQVVSDIASKLKSAAQQATGPMAQRLSKMADRFQKVADTGDLSQLQPQQPPQGSSSASGLQGLLLQYTQQSQQDPSGMIQQTNGLGGDRDGDHDQMRSIMSGIFNELNQALSGIQTSTTTGTQTSTATGTQGSAASGTQGSAG